MPSAPYKPWVGPPMHERPHGCSVPGCTVRQAGFGIERIVVDGDGNRIHGADQRFFCKDHLDERDAYAREINAPAPAGGADDRVERPSLAAAIRRAYPDIKQRSLL